MTDSSTELVELLGGTPVIPVLTVDDVDESETVGRALLRGGLASVEVVFRTARAAEAIERLSSIEGLTVGAGTLLTADQVATAVRAGARFGVAPSLDDDVVAACRAHGLPFIPGVATPSEVGRARTLGLQVVKIFPAEQLGGPAFVRALAQVFADTRFVPTGGIDAAGAALYLELPSVLACGGSWLVKPGLPLDEVEQLARDAAGLRR